MSAAQADNGGHGLVLRFAEQACAERDLDRRLGLVREIAHHGQDTRMALLRRLMSSDDPQARMLGADVITLTPCYAGREVREFAIAQGLLDASVEPYTDADCDWLAQVLSKHLDSTQDPDLIYAIIQAIGEQELGAAADSVIRHIGDADVDVRTAAAQTLGNLGYEKPPPDGVVDALLRLARDPVGDVRSWALFALGRGGGTPVDTAATRAVFIENRVDPDEEIRAEAVIALALLGDVESLEEALSNYDYDEDLVEAACRAGDPRLQAPLQELLVKETSSEQSDPETAQHVEAVLRRAINACGVYQP